MANNYIELDVELEGNVYVSPAEVLFQISTEDLMDELEQRQDATAFLEKGSLTSLYYKYTRGESIDAELRDMFYNVLGRVA